MIVIGLTGGIGSGKSAASNYLISKKIDVIDADKVAREITAPGSETLKELADAFGSDIILPDGTLDRKKLGDIVFGNSDKMRMLNNITHRKITEKIKKKITDSDSEIVVVDAPLLIETGLNCFTDEVWVVDADEKIRIDRLMKRDNLTEAEIKRRINSQLTREERLKYADVVIDNSGTLKHLTDQLDKQIERLTQINNR